MKSRDDSHQLIETSILVVGSEGAGARAAIEARLQGLDAMIVTKGKIGQCGATMLAGADLTVDGKSAHDYCGLSGDLTDSPEKFFQEIVADGLFINNQEIVEAYIEGCPIIVKDLIDWGMKVYGFESVHAEAHMRGVYTVGREIVGALRRKVRQLGVRLSEDTIITDLLVSDGRISGVIGVNILTGEIIVIKASAVILATGGWQMAYTHNDAGSDLTGDGQAMAYRSGAEMINMEMVEFVPFVVFKPEMCRGMIAAHLFVIGGGPGWILNKLGERIMDKYDPRLGELSTKEIMSIAIAKEVAEGRGSPLGGVYMSWKHVPVNIIDDVLKQGNLWFSPGGKYSQEPLWAELVKLLRNGYAIEGGVSAHFMIGGIHVNQYAETTVPGLYAAGECSGGLWGAARVAAATSQAVVQGRKAAQSAANFVKKNPRVEINSKQLNNLKAKLLLPLENDKGIEPIELRKEVKSLTDNGAGPIRNEKSINNSLEKIKILRKDTMSDLCVASTKTRRCNMEWIECLQIANMCQCVELSLASASIRQESRGCHYREDFPVLNNDDWIKNIVSKDKNGELVTEIRPVVKTTLDLPKGKISYEESIGIATKSLTK